MIETTTCRRGFEYKSTDEFCIRFNNGVPDWCTTYEGCAIAYSEPFDLKFHGKYLDKLK
jgi:hypothetical protein